MQIKQINIYTDGACSGNQFDENIGGWGAILEYQDNRKEIYGGTAQTTNNRMEMTAVLEALAVLRKDGYIINLFSDSSYVINCLNKRWYEKWLKNGWLTTAKNPVENRDLWEGILPYLEVYEFRYYLVKGHVNPKALAPTLKKYYEKFVKHNGDGFTFEEYLYITEKNNRADELANTGIEKVRSAEAKKTAIGQRK